MRFENSVGRLLVGLLVCFGAVMAAAVYWTVIGPETVLSQPINYRLRDAAGTLIRGAMLDRDENILVETIPTDASYVTRRTADPSLYSLTGYSSVQYGVSGAEAAYNAILSGTDAAYDLGSAIRYDLLHLPRLGSDIQLTISIDAQRAAADALATLGRPGGIVVMDAVTGELLAVASAPAVDPSSLDVNWAMLISDPGRPFINRATQGQYDPGSTLAPAVLAAWLIDGHDVNAELPAELFTPCPEMSGRTVREAFTLHCVPALDAMATLLGRAKIEDMIELFGLRTPIALGGFTQPAELASAETTANPDDSDFNVDSFGLESITRSPLELAVMTAAIAAGGNAPRPILLGATRPPDGIDWIPAERGGQLMAVTTAQTASAVANAMRSSATNGPAQSDICLGTDIGAVLGVSDRGEHHQAFYVGFASLNDGHTIVAALAIEDTDLFNAAEIADAGNAVLCAALAAYAEG